MSGGRKRAAPQARHVVHQEPGHLPGQNLPEHTKRSRQRAKHKAAEARKRARGA